MHPFHRTELLVGGAGFERLRGSSVCIVGLGGVGGHAAEALARSGVGHLTLVDFDRVCLTNLNRQVHAMRSTVGQSKAALMKARLEDINPSAEVRGLEVFYNAETSDQVLDRPYDAVLDCIDNMAAKLHLLERCAVEGRPVWAAMGAGGKMDPTRVRVSDLSQTKNDPLARIVRKQLRKKGIERGIHAVWSDEAPNELDRAAEEGFRCICPDKANSPNSCDQRFQVQGSVAWMPSIFGLTMAASVVHAVLQRPMCATDVAPGATKQDLALQPVSRISWEVTDTRA